MHIHNRNHLKKLRRELRANLTLSEARLWKALQKSRLEGRKFRRQHSIGEFIVDFYCPKERLVIEIDGDHHFTASGEIADTERDQYLKNLNIRVLRFSNEIVYRQFDVVTEIIRENFKD